MWIIILFIMIFIMGVGVFVGVIVFCFFRKVLC